MRSWKGTSVCRFIVLDLDWHIYMQVNYGLKKVNCFNWLWFVLISTLLSSWCVCGCLSVSVCIMCLMAPLTWPGAPRSSCSGTVGCRKETGSLPISSWLPSLLCSPLACLQSKLGQNTSPCGSNWGDRRRCPESLMMPPDGLFSHFIRSYFIFYLFIFDVNICSCQEKRHRHAS